MKNACKHFALCTLTLILCLALAACGSDNSGDSADYGNDSTVPSTIDGFVKESYDSYDYSAFEGYYLPDSGTDFDYLIIDTNGSRWRIGNNDDLAASGYLQYDADYDCIYAYNEHDGVAYQFSADGSSVNIYSLGSFTYEMSLDEFDAQAEDYNSSDSSVDLSYLAGIWYLDGDLDADSYIYTGSFSGVSTSARPARRRPRSTAALSRPRPMWTTCTMPFPRRIRTSPMNSRFLTPIPSCGAARTTTTSVLSKPF